MALDKSLPVSLCKRLKEERLDKVTVEGLDKVIRASDNIADSLETPRSSSLSPLPHNSKQCSRNSVRISWKFLKCKLKFR